MVVEVMTAKKQKKEKKDEGVSPPKANILASIFGRGEEAAQPTEAENIKEIITEWLHPNHIKRKTRLTKKQVVAISILQSLSDTYTIKTLDRFLNEFRTNKLSEDGKSSRELENILKARIQDVEETNIGRLSKFLE